MHAINFARMQIHLKAARDRKGWTLEQLSDASGINKSTISRLERNETQPLLSTVNALEDALELKRGTLTFEQAAVA
jgi:transcriptional regulator with XRE-family HTH domain